MKTAEEIYIQMDGEVPYDINFKLQPYIIEAMKIYAKQVAEKALKDASEKQLLGKTTTSIITEILKTEIKLP